jgi:peroxiredoxin 2/4
MTHAIARAYGVETPDGTAALRGSFLVDRAGVVRHQIVNDLPLGRDVDEMLRVVDALQYHEQYGEVCPAGWRRGKAAMKETYESVASYLALEGASL